ncbi:hypothetical protein INN71_11825 [Nocardioides sp. ChNu-153]|uniref:hypothetical protein n=1 Tax=unclassified Nocardioides TaxID=2615069 RepID=UPI00240521F1|nr:MULTISPECIES: hypothetical protein [unclassified Nocardioides]MDF9716504.1 hypothetical protein [Nocardioides sp. ChNu-99]MDN7122077.1 hypothetical protein [Nocardioides sp. ChNu-153]
MRVTVRRGVRRGVAIAAGMVLTTSVVAGCGGDEGSGGDDSSGGGSDDSAEEFADSSAEDIIAAAQEAVEGAESFRVAGEIEEDGDTVEVDLMVDEAGDCTGEMTLGSVGGLQIVGVDGSYWVKGDAEFWTAAAGDPAAAAVFADKWVVDAEQDFAEVCDIETFRDYESDGDVESPEKGDVTEVDGEEAVEVTFTDDDGETATISVLTSEPHYLVQLERETGAFTLSDFDEPVDAEEPPADEVFDPSTLG